MLIFGGDVSVGCTLPAFSRRKSGVRRAEVQISTGISFRYPTENVPKSQFVGTTCEMFRGATLHLLGPPHKLMQRAAHHRFDDDFIDY